jgi:UMF1 family MFS transporter
MTSTTMKEGESTERTNNEDGLVSEGGTCLASTDETRMRPLDEDQLRSPTITSFEPRCCGRLWFGGNPEALGWALDVTGRTVAVIGLGAFLAPALMNLAKEEAGCETEAPPGEHKVPECNETVYGIKPSSLFTTILTIVAVCSAPLLPLMGAIVDYTPHRRLIGRTVSSLFCATIFPLIFVNEDNWFLMTILFIVAFFIFMFQMVLAYSYLPELTDQEDILNDFTRNFTILTFSTIVLYLAVVAAIAGGTGVQEDEVATARIGQSIAFCLCLACLSVAWGKLFQSRPPSRILLAGKSVWTAGFKELYSTIIKIKGGYRALRWFFVAIAFSDSALHSLMTILITFLSDKLEFESMEIGIAIAVMLLFSVPGGWMAGRVTRKSNPITSCLAALISLIANTSVAAAVLTGPERKEFTFLFVAIWGFATAWKWTSDRMLVSVIIPSGQNTELMGLYLFSTMVITWVPPLVFTALNEAGVSQRVGLAFLDVFFVLSIICYLFMGPYRAAVEAAQGQISETS